MEPESGGIKSRCRKNSKTIARVIFTDSDSKYSSDSDAPTSDMSVSTESPRDSPRAIMREGKTPSPRRILSPLMRKLSADTKDKKGGEVSDKIGDKTDRIEKHRVDTNPSYAQNVCDGTVYNIASTSSESVVERKIPKRSQSATTGTPRINITSSNSVSNNSSATNERVNENAPKYKSFIASISRSCIRGIDIETINIGVDNRDSLNLIQSGYHGIKISDGDTQYYITYSKEVIVSTSENNRSFPAYGEGTVPSNIIALQNDRLTQKQTIELYKPHFPIVVKSNKATFSEDDFMNIFLRIMYSIYASTNVS